jgi:hypothetical protein
VDAAGESSAAAAGTVVFYVVADSAWGPTHVNLLVTFAASDQSTIREGRTGATLFCTEFYSRLKCDASYSERRVGGALLELVAQGCENRADPVNVWSEGA